MTKEAIGIIWANDSDDAMDQIKKIYGSKHNGMHIAHLPPERGTYREVIKNF
jgi:hypothetical protein